MAFGSYFHQDNVEGLRMGDGVLGLVDGDDIARGNASLEHAAPSNKAPAQATGSDGVKGIRIDRHHIGLRFGRHEDVPLGHGPELFRAAASNAVSTACSRFPSAKCYWAAYLTSERAAPA